MHTWFPKIYFSSYHNLSEPPLFQIFDKQGEILLRAGGFSTGIPPMDAIRRGKSWPRSKRNSSNRNSNREIPWSVFVVEFSVLWNTGQSKLGAIFLLCSLSVVWAVKNGKLTNRKMYFRTFDRLTRREEGVCAPTVWRSQQPSRGALRRNVTCESILFTFKRNSVNWCLSSLIHSRNPSTFESMRWKGRSRMSRKCGVNSARWSQVYRGSRNPTVFSDDWIRARRVGLWCKFGAYVEKL